MCSVWPDVKDFIFVFLSVQLYASSPLETSLNITKSLIKHGLLPTITTNKMQNTFRNRFDQTITGKPRPSRSCKYQDVTVPICTDCTNVPHCSNLAILKYKTNQSLSPDKDFIFVLALFCFRPSVLITEVHVLPFFVFSLF